MSKHFKNHIKKLNKGKGATFDYIKEEEEKVLRTIEKD